MVSITITISVTITINGINIMFTITTWHQT